LIGVIRRGADGRMCLSVRLMPAAQCLARNASILYRYEHYGFDERVSGVNFTFRLIRFVTVSDLTPLLWKKDV